MFVAHALAAIITHIPTCFRWKVEMFSIIH